jgi:hypothetical protein
MFFLNMVCLTVALTTNVGQRKAERSREAKRKNKREKKEIKRKQKSTENKETVNRRVFMGCCRVHGSMGPWVPGDRTYLQGEYCISVTRNLYCVWPPPDPKPSQGLITEANLGEGLEILY